MPNDPTHPLAIFLKGIRADKNRRNYGMIDALQSYDLLSEHLPTLSTLVYFHRTKIRLLCKHFFLTWLRFAFSLQYRSLDLWNN